MKKWPYFLIIISGILWGTIGIFVQGLYQMGLNSLEIVALRVMIAAILLVAFAFFTNQSYLKIKWRDSVYFIGTGIFGIAFFNLCYFIAIREVSTAVAAILLYTAPAFVTVLSRIIFKEALTYRKLFSLTCTFMGIPFIVGFFPNFKSAITPYGLVVGISSGLGYALYSILGKAALRKYHVYTITTYTFIFASIGIIPISGLWNYINLLNNLRIWMYIAGLGVFPTALAYILYMMGLSYVESSRASITATIEPAVATLIGIFVFKEILTLWQVIGIILILLAIFIVQESKEDCLVEYNKSNPHM